MYIDDEEKEYSGIRYKLVSINCSCGAIHELFEGLGEGALYICGLELKVIGEGDSINIDYGC